MKVLILAIGRSGTTALLHKVASALPESQAFSGGKLKKVAEISGNAVFKHTYNEARGRTFEKFNEHLRQTEYDRKIWIARDPETMHSVVFSSAGTGVPKVPGISTAPSLTWLKRKSET